MSRNRENVGVIMFAVFACSAALSKYYRICLKYLYCLLVASSPAAAGSSCTVQTNPISPQLYQLTITSERIQLTGCLNLHYRRTLSTNCVKW